MDQFPDHQQAPEGSNPPQSTPPINIGNEFVAQPVSSASASMPASSTPVSESVVPPVPPVAPQVVQPTITSPASNLEQPVNPAPSAPLPSSPAPGVGQPVASSFQPPAQTSSEPVVSFSAQQPEGAAPIDFQVGSKSKKKLITILASSALGILLLSGGAAAYFGVIGPNKPENLWNSALVNTGKGYDKLVDASNKTQNIKDWSQKGNFKLSGAFAADGTFDGKSSGDTSQYVTDVSAVGLKLNLDVRTFPSANSTPDFYIKAEGLQGVGTLLSSYSGSSDPQVQNALNSINGQWYVIDHTLFDQFSQGTNTTTQINGKDLTELLQSVGATSKKYIFTSNTQDAAIGIQEKVGRETHDGRSTYHYKVHFKKAELKKYLEAVCNDAKTSKIGKSLGGDITSSYDCKGAAKSADSLKESDTADAWVDTKTRLIHSIRFTDQKHSDNYVEIAQNFTGGDTMPFKLTYHSVADGSTDTAELAMNYNTKNQNFDFSGSFGSASKDSSSDEKGTFTLKIAPTTGAVHVDKPANAKTIIELINSLGFGDTYSNTTAEPINSHTTPHPASNNNKQAVILTSVLKKLQNVNQKG